METTKKNSQAGKALSIILSFALLLNSFSYAFNTNKVRYLVNYTGEQYFKAIYFKKGDLAAKVYKNGLDELIKKEYSANDLANIEEIQNLIIKTIMTQNPNFMSDFEKGIESSDLTVIENTVIKGGDLIYRTINSLEKGVLKDNSIYQKYLSGFNSATTPADKQACVIYIVCLYVCVIVYTYILYPYATGYDKDEQSQLNKEQFIYNIYELQK